MVLIIILIVITQIDWCENGRVNKDTVLAFLHFCQVETEHLNALAVAELKI